MDLSCLALGLSLKATFSHRFYVRKLFVEVSVVEWSIHISESKAESKHEKAGVQTVEELRSRVNITMLALKMLEI